MFCWSLIHDHIHFEARIWVGYHHLGYQGRDYSCKKKLLRLCFRFLVPFLAYLSHSRIMCLSCVVCIWQHDCCWHAFVCFFYWISKQIHEAGTPEISFLPFFRLWAELWVGAFFFVFEILNPRSPCQREQRKYISGERKNWKAGNPTPWIAHDAITVSFFRHCCWICYSTSIWQDHHVV